MRRSHAWRLRSNRSRCPLLRDTQDDVEIITADQVQPRDPRTFVQCRHDRGVEGTAAEVVDEDEVRFGVCGYPRGECVLKPAVEGSLTIARTSQPARRNARGSGAAQTRRAREYRRASLPRRGTEATDEFVRTARDTSGSR